MPAAFVLLDALPLTPNGKLDRKALPAPERGAYATREYEAPQGEIEADAGRDLAASCCGVERVGRHDNFFELGGHSLLVVQLMERLRQRGLAAECAQRVRRVRRWRTLAQALARECSAACAVPPNLIPPDCERDHAGDAAAGGSWRQQQIERIVAAVPGGARNVQDIYPLAPLQEGILFHHLLNERSETVCAADAAGSCRSREQLDALIAALQAVIDRHDILRTAVLWEELPRAGAGGVAAGAAAGGGDARWRRQGDALEQMRARWLDRSGSGWICARRRCCGCRWRAIRDGARWYALLQLHHMVCDHVDAGDRDCAKCMAHLRGRLQQLAAAAAVSRLRGAGAGYGRSSEDASSSSAASWATSRSRRRRSGCCDVHGGRHADRGGTAAGCRRRAGASGCARSARALGVSAATLFHAAWALVVARTSGREDVVFGTVLLGRMQGTAGARAGAGDVHQHAAAAAAAAR